MARVGKGSPRNAPIVKGVQSVPPKGHKTGAGRTDYPGGTKTISKVKNPPAGQ